MEKVNIIDIHKVFDKHLNSSLAIPSTAHAFSSCIEHVYTNWFLSKFPDDYFKSKHLNTRHVLDDYKQLDKTEMLKREKPALSVTANIDNDFDRDKIDSYMSGIEMWTRRSSYEDSFFKDKAKDVYIGMNLRVIVMNFNFKIKVASRTQQLDLAEYMRMCFRVGYSQSEYISYDFHVPYNLMRQVAVDYGFELDEKRKIKDVFSFLSVLNGNSSIPFLYKYRAVNGLDEFFIRLNNLYVRTLIANPLSLDDGERQEQLETNFTVEMNAEVRFPAPKYYMYYSETEHDEIEVKETVNKDDVVLINTIKLESLPSTNISGWNLFLTTDLQEENTKEFITCDFKDLFADKDLGKVIDYTKSINISPATFMDFKLYNNGKEIPYTMNWESDELRLTTTELVTLPVSSLGVYVDTNYTANALIQIDKLYEDRLR